MAKRAKNPSPNRQAEQAQEPESAAAAAQVGQEEPAQPPTAATLGWFSAAGPLGAAALTVAATLIPQGPYPAVAQGALVLGAAATLAATAGALRRSTWASVAAAVLALLSFLCLQCAVPGLQGIGEPLRGALAGVTPPMMAALACAGFAALALRPTTAARALAALGTLALVIYAWMPAGFAGQLVLPVVAAVQGVMVGAQAGADPQLTALSGANWLFLLGLLAPLLLSLLLLRPNWTAGLALAAALALAVPCVAAALGGGLFLVLGTVGLLLAVSACALPWLRDEPEVLVQRPWTAAWEPVLVAAIVASYLLLKTNALRYSTTDESLYFYAAKAWAEGTLPYRDFFFSHPPLHLAVPALLYKVLGFHFLIGKWLSALAALTGGLFAWRLARQWLGPLGGTAALALHLFACEVLQASTNLTGINLTTAWLLAGVWAGLGHRRFLAAGMLVGAATCTGFYAVGGALALVVLGLLVPKQDAQRPLWHHPSVRVAVGFLAVWGAINVVFWRLGGDAYTLGVYAYHFAKKAKVDGFTPLSESPVAVLSNFFAMLGAKDFQVTLYYHAAHWWWALALPVAATVRAHVEQRSLADVLDPRRWWAVPSSRPLLMWALAWAMILEFGSFKERYDFYFALLLPMVSVAAAAFLTDAAWVGLACLRPGKRPILAFCSVAVLGGLWMNVAMSANRTAYPSEFGGAKMDGKGPGERLVFEWLPAPGPAWVSQWTQALFWQEYRVRGSIETGIHHYLWGKKRWFSKAEEMAAWIRDHSAPDDTISGASDYAPLLALLSGRRMAGNHIDTNSKVFNTGVVPVERFWDEACRDKLKFLVIAPNSYFAVQDLAKRTSLVENFRQDKVFSDPALKHWRSLDMELWVKKTDAPCTYRGQRGVAPLPTE